MSDLLTLGDGTVLDTTMMTPVSNAPGSYLDWATGGSAGAASSSSSTSPLWGIFSNLANQWTKIGGQVIAPQTTLNRSADGSLAITTPGTEASSAAVFGTGVGVSSSGSSLLLLGALAIGGVVLFSMLKK